MNEEAEFRALLGGQEAVLLSAGHLRFRPPVKAGDLAGAFPQRGSQTVRGRVPAADHRDAVSNRQRFPPAFGQDGRIDIQAGQEFIRRKNARQIDSGNLHAGRDRGAGPQEYGLIPVPQKRIHGMGFPDGDAGADLHAGVTQILDQDVDDCLIEFKFRNAVGEQAPGTGRGFENRHRMPLQDELFGARQPGCPGAGHRDALPAGGAGNNVEGVLCAFEIGRKGFQRAAQHRFVIFIPDAGALTKLFERANPPANLGHGRRPAVDFRRAEEIPLFDF